MEEFHLLDTICGLLSYSGRCQQSLCQLYESPSYRETVGDQSSVITCTGGIEPQRNIEKLEEDVESLQLINSDTIVMHLFRIH